MLMSGPVPCSIFYSFFLKLILTNSFFLKVHGPISQNGGFFFFQMTCQHSTPKKSWFKILVLSVKPFGDTRRLRILQLPIPFCVSLLIMVTITSQIACKMRHLPVQCQLVP